MPMIPDELMGDFWPRALPGPDKADYGVIEFAPEGRFPVRSFQSFTLTYRVGAFGLDDTGAIKIVSRWTNDGGAVQFTDPSGINYVTAIASNGVELELHAEPYPHQRPWYNGIRITVKRGYMSPGDSIRIVLGDRSGGSPGLRLQSFCETAHELRVLADVCATGVFLPVSRHFIEIVPGPVASWVVAAPTLRRVGEIFSVGIRGEDAWGNASDQTVQGLILRATGSVEGLPEVLNFRPGARGLRLGELVVREPGTYRFCLENDAGDVLAVSNPVMIKPSGPAAFWGDLHGQSGETVGINPLREYFEFARDVAFLDVTSHQANDFQITNAFWQHINEQTALFDDPGRFCVFPGYEWSGNTPVGGDHNVFFQSEGRPIRRSSHALLEDRSDIESDANTLGALFEALQDEDCVVYAHIGGRPADIAKAEDPRLRTAVEVHSDWGTFEWIMTDAFKLGYRVGLVCNSDGHKGAPGACYPGASEFGAYSGLTCFLADELSREAIFESMRQRRHYGTTGCRMYLEVTADLGETGGVFPTDPRIERCSALPARTAHMGDIARLDGDRVTVSVRVDAHAPVERIEVLNGAEIVETFRPHRTAASRRIRVIWQGAEYRGRGRTTHWRGSIRFDQARIRNMRKVNIWNLERPFRQLDEHSIAFDAATTGNFSGCDIWLGSNDGTISIETDLVSGRFELTRISDQDVTLDAGGLDRKIRLFRLPEQMDQCSVAEIVSVNLVPGQDNPLWVRVTTEDGHVAWSSPIYVTR